MSSRPRLVLDDPLDGRPSPPPPEPEHEAAPRRRPRATTKPRPASSPAPRPQPAPTQDLSDSQQPQAKEWRDWAGPKRVASFRLPDELLEEINTTSDQLGIPIGHLVIAGLTTLLDHSADEITALADRVAQTLLRGKRNARRKKTTGTA